MTLRGADKGGDAGNQIGVAVMPLHTEIADPLERLRGDPRRRRQGQGAGERRRQGLCQARLRPVAGGGVGARSRRRVMLPTMNIVVSNVRGPGRAALHGGCAMVAFAPVSIALDGLGLNVTGFSYHGTMWVCAVACRDMMPDPAFFADCLRRQLPVSRGRCHRAARMPAPQPREARRARGKKVRNDDVCASCSASNLLHGKNATHDACCHGVQDTGTLARLRQAVVAFRILTSATADEPGLACGSLAAVTRTVDALQQWASRERGGQLEATGGFLMTSESMVLGRRNTVLAAVIGTVLASLCGQRDRARVRVRQRRARQLEHDAVGRLELARRGSEPRAVHARRRFADRPVFRHAADRPGRRSARSDGLAGNQAAGDGNLNYDKGDRFSTPFKLITDVEIKKGNFGALVRVKAWYDQALNDEEVRVGNQANEYNGVRSGLGPVPGYRPCTGHAGTRRATACRSRARPEPLAEGQAERRGLRGRAEVRQRLPARRLRVRLVRHRRHRPAAAPRPPGGQLGRERLHPGRQPDQPDRRAGRAPRRRRAQGNPAAGVDAYANWGLPLRLARGVLPAQVGQHLGRRLRHLLHGDQHADLERPGLAAAASPCVGGQLGKLATGHDVVRSSRSSARSRMRAAAPASTCRPSRAATPATAASSASRSASRSTRSTRRSACTG